MDNLYGLKGNEFLSKLKTKVIERKEKVLHFVFLFFHEAVTTRATAHRFAWVISPLSSFVTVTERNILSVTNLSLAD